MVMLQNGHTEVVLWSENGHVTEVVSSMEREWSCYGGGQFNGGRMIMLEGWSVLWRENGHFTEVFTLMEGEWSCYGGCHFNGREYGHVTEVVTLMEG